MTCISPSLGARTALKLSTSLAALAVAIPAAAQDAAPQAEAQQPSPAPAASGENENEILVTGSRVRRSTFETPNPVTVLGSEEVENLGLVNVAEVVKQLPQNSNFFSANNVGLGNFNVGAQLVNLRGLNPFFGTRTLTLIDTRRVVATTAGGGVDITLVPSMLVGRVETVTGGASAVYGSDAIAGVVNVILDKSLEGFKAQADYGATTHGDGDDWHAAAAYGTGFADGRGHFIVGAEYQDTSAIGNCAEERDWCAKGYSLFNNTEYATPGTPGFGEPHYVIGPNATIAYSSSTGALSPCLFFVPGAGFCAYVPAVTGPTFQFNPEGTAAIPFDSGRYSAGSFPIFGLPRQGGDEFATGNYDGTTLRPSVEKLSTLARVEFEVSPAITVSLEGSYARSEAVNPNATGAVGPFPFLLFDPFLLGFQIAPDNAFLPPSVAAMIPNGASFGRTMNNLQNARNETNNETWRLVGALEGEIGGGWTWDAYYSHGENHNDQHLLHNMVQPLLRFALDAVQTPDGIVCGVTIPGRINPDTGFPYTPDNVAFANAAGPCVPLNLFGSANADQAAIDYAFRTLDEFVNQKQDVAAFNIRGDLFDGWGAGPIKLATGAEWRRESGEVTHDLANQPWYSGYYLTYGGDYAGKTEVLEGYVELNVPVFRDAPVGRYLEVDGAIRGTRNKNEGTLGNAAGQSRTREFVTWKLSGIWDATDWLRVRATRSRDVRAAQFRELFETRDPFVGPPFGVVNNPWPGGTANDAIIATIGGDVNLQPEKADTLTIGLILSPQGGALAGFRFSADWYQIEIEDAIASGGIGAQNIVTGCFQGNQVFCDRIVGEGTADIISVYNNAANLQGFVTRGVDFEAAYNLPLDEDSSLNLRVLASYLYDQLFDTGQTDPVTGEPVPPRNYAGTSGPTAAFGSFNTAPEWQGNAFVTYTNGPFTGTVQARYVGPGRFMVLTAAGGPPIDPGDPGYDSTDPNSISDNSVNDALYFNLAGSFDVTEEVQLFGALNNVFDKDPPIAPGGNGFPTNPVYFDTFGRTFRVGARVNF
jgi:outer membrane receptor protein involved in Fe transport